LPRGAPPNDGLYSRHEISRGRGRRQARAAPLLQGVEMGSLSIWHVIIAVVVLAVLFGGRGRISGIMGDTAKGIRAFREGLKGEDEPKTADAKPLPKESEKG
jgi:sec-independent protein translocase protein TatA